jgi:ATP-dependent Clp protease ATP-binding subunit ClpC
MDGSGSGGGKVFGRFTEAAHRVLGLAREEAERCGHRYLGPEHVLVGVAADARSAAAGVLQANRVDLKAARAALDHLTKRGVVPALRPSDTELLGSLGIDLDAVRRDTEQTFGFLAHVGLPEGYRGAAGLLLVELGVDQNQLREAVMVEHGGGQR